MKYSAAALIAAVMLLATLAYFPGLHGPYVLDDDENVRLQPAVALTELNRDSLRSALQGNDSGPLGRPLAALSFALNHYATGGFDNTFAFKATNLGIHLLNTLLAYLLILRLLETPVMRVRPVHAQRQLLAVFASALWALHPLQLTNVLYVVQRMNSLSASFVLLGLLVFLHGRQQLATGAKHGLTFMISGIGAGTLLGIGVKENAALLPVYALIVELILFRDENRTKELTHTLRAFYTVTVILPVVFVLAYVAIHPASITAAYAERRFTPWERLLTESRVLWFYIRLILLPAPSALGLFHDDIPLSTGLFTPVTTAISSTGIFVTLGFAIAMRRRYPAVAFAALWFLAGHVLESSLLGLEIAYEHRNYLPSLGVFFCIAMGLHRVTQINQPLRRGAVVAVATLPLALAFATWNRAHTWTDTLTLAEDSVYHHPLSARANDFVARAILERDDTLVHAIPYLLRGTQLAPRAAAFHIELRTLLAVLTRKINTTLTAAAQQPTPLELHVQGLPAEIRATTADGRATLAYTPSSDETIGRLLAEEPITVHEIVALENLRACLLETPHWCRELERPARDWFAAAADNPQTSKIYRGILLGNLARLRAAAGDYDGAYLAATQAEGFDPAHLTYHLQRVEYLVNAGKLEAARSLWALTLSTFDVSNQRDPRSRQTIESLRKQFAETKHPPRSP